MSYKHLKHSCQAIVVACMDFRLQKIIHEWAVKNIKGQFDMLTLAGGVKDLNFVLGQIELSVKLHHTKEVYLINHEDCGAYGKTGNYKKHQNDLKYAKSKIAEKFPKLKIYLFYLKLDGKFVKV